MFTIFIFAVIGFSIASMCYLTNTSPESDKRISVESLPEKNRLEIENGFIERIDHAKAATEPFEQIVNDPLYVRHSG